jgi:hypothetical protein
VASIADTAKAGFTDTATLQTKVTAWYELKAAIATLTEQEKALRTDIAQYGFPDVPEKGSVRADLGYGKELKLTTKLNYTVDKNKLAMVGDNALPPDIRDAVFRMKPEVVEAALLAVTDPDVMHVLSDIITSKPGLPALEVVDAKKRG